MCVSAGGLHLVNAQAASLQGRARAGNSNHPEAQHTCHVDATVQVFHAGTKAGPDGQLVAAGGRVLGITALGGDIAEAQQRAYQVPGLRKHFRS